MLWLHWFGQLARRTYLSATLSSSFLCSCCTSQTLSSQRPAAPSLDTTCPDGSALRRPGSSFSARCNAASCFRILFLCIKMAPRSSWATAISAANRLRARAVAGPSPDFPAQLYVPKIARACGVSSGQQTVPPFDDCAAASYCRIFPIEIAQAKVYSRAVAQFHRQFELAIASGVLPAIAFCSPVSNCAPMRNRIALQNPGKFFERTIEFFAKDSSAQGRCAIQVGRVGFRCSTEIFDGIGKLPRPVITQPE